MSIFPKLIVLMTILSLIYVDSHARKKSSDPYPNGYVTHGGLTWRPNNLTSLKGWPKSNDYCKKLAVNGLMGWRLPTLSELVSLYGSRTLTSNNAGNKHWNFRYATWASDLDSKRMGLSIILNNGTVVNNNADKSVAAISCVHENVGL